MNRISSRELQYLVAIDEVQHFGRAAERCCVSQPHFEWSAQEAGGESRDSKLVEAYQQACTDDPGRERNRHPCPAYPH